MGKVETSPVAYEDGATPDFARRIGARVRALRLERKMSVNGLAAAASLSAGIVSHIERERGNPSLNTIEKIRVALGVPLSALLDEEPDSQTQNYIRRREERTRIVIDESSLMKEIISPVGCEGLRMMIITFPPGSRSLDVVMDPGQKAGLVLEGTVKLVVEGAESVLREGDSFQFPSTLPHSVHNESGKAAKVLWLISPNPTGIAI